MYPKKFNYIPPTGKWNRLFEAQRMLRAVDQVLDFDRLEPITDFTDALAVIAKIKAKL